MGFEILKTTYKPFSAEAIRNLGEAIGVMGKGMFGIFVVMALFYIMLIGLSKLKDKEQI